MEATQKISPHSLGRGGRLGELRGILICFSFFRLLRDLFGRGRGGGCSGIGRRMGGLLGRGGGRSGLAFCGRGGRLDGFIRRGEAFRPAGEGIVNYSG